MDLAMASVPCYPLADVSCASPSLTPTLSLSCHGWNQIQPRNARKRACQRFRHFREAGRIGQCRKIQQQAPELVAKLLKAGDLQQTAQQHVELSHQSVLVASTCLSRVKCKALKDPEEDATWIIKGESTQESATQTEQPAESGKGFERKKLAVFVSGGGSNFRVLHNSIMENKIYGDIIVVVSDKPACKACEYARSNSIPVIEFPKSKHAVAGLSPPELVNFLRLYEVDFVLLAGYLKLLPEELTRSYPKAILNIHPALLPAFGGKGYYGMKVHEAVIRSGARFSGPTIHFVDEKYDSGVILAQRIVPVLPYDTPDDLASRVLKEEHVIYSEAVAAVCEDRIFWREDGVPMIRKSWDEAEYY